MSKYDWEALKIEYMNAPALTSIKEFFQSKFGKDVDWNNGNFMLQTSGWVKEKVQLRKEAFEEEKKFLKEKYKMPVENAYIAMKNAFVEVASRFSAEKIKQMSATEIEACLKILYNLLGEKYGISEVDANLTVNVENLVVLQNIFNDIKKLQLTDNSGSKDTTDDLQTGRTIIPGDTGTGGNS